MNNFEYEADRNVAEAHFKQYKELKQKISTLEADIKLWSIRDKKQDEYIKQLEAENKELKYIKLLEAENKELKDTIIKITEERFKNDISFMQETGNPRCNICKALYRQTGKYEWETTCEHSKGLKLGFLGKQLNSKSSEGKQ